jgi:hypothetical protein
VIVEGISRPVVRSPLALLLAVGALGHAWAGCAPEKMARIVFRDGSPDVDRESFAGQPATLYRLGSKYARLEEAPDPEHGIHGLSINAEPDIWMINVMTKSGQHILDPGEPYVVHVPVFGGPEDPEFLKTFEFGCELQYMRERKVQPQPSTIGRFKLDNYRVTVRDQTIGLSIIAGTERPLFAVFLKNGNVVKSYQYVQYDLGLAPQLELFAPPAGIKIEEAKR